MSDEIDDGASSGASRSAKTGFRRRGNDQPGSITANAVFQGGKRRLPQGDRANVLLLGGQ
jgi:hypothetical protein